MAASEEILAGSRKAMTELEKRIDDGTVKDSTLVKILYGQVNEAVRRV